MAEDDPNAGFQFYHYKPSVAAAAVFLILFLATSVIHTWQMFKNRTWFFVAFIIGGFCMEISPLPLFSALPLPT